jgi:RNA polymerase-associated protein LEO1
MASNQELFGDDDSSSSSPSSDDVKMKDAPPEEKAEKSPSKNNRELFGDDSSSSSEEEEKKEKAPPKAATASEEEAPKKEEEDSSGEKQKDEIMKQSDDDDDDEGDVEFDDKDVVGVESTTLAGDKLNHPRPTEDRASVSGRKGEAAGEEAAESSRIDKRTLRLQEVEHRPRLETDQEKLFITKLPNLVGIQTEAFDPDTYAAGVEEQDFGQAAYNLVRWRYKRDDTGNLVRDPTTDQLQRESNTRLVRWEDGSYTLHVGTEAFQIDLTDKPDKKSEFPGLNGYLYLSQKATYRNGNDEEGKDDEPEESAGTVLECMGPIASRLLVRPSSLQSEAHKSLTVGIRQKTIKKARIAEFVTQEDPEKLKQERMRAKADLDRAAKKRAGGAAAAGSYPRERAPRRPRMSRAYLEEEEDDDHFDTTNIKAMKRRTMYEDEDLDDYGDDDYGESEEEDETFRRVRPGKKDKGKKVESEESSDEEVVFGNEDEEDDEVVSPVVKQAGKKRSHQAVLDDDESD